MGFLLGSWSCGDTFTNLTWVRMIRKRSVPLRFETANTHTYLCLCNTPRLPPHLQHFQHRPFPTWNEHCLLR